MQWPKDSSSKLRVRSWDMDESLETMTLKSVPTKDGSVFVTWTNFGYVDFAVTWAENLRRNGIENMYIGAMDVETSKVLHERGFPTFAMYAKGQNSTGLTTADFNWGTPHFAEMGRQKAGLAQHFLRLGVSELILSDSDVVCQRDPRPFFASHPEADLLSQTDAVVPTIPPGDPGLERASVLHTMVNIGLLVLRHRPAMRAFLDKWMEGLVADPGKWDQAVFYELITGRAEGLRPLPSFNETQRVVPVWDGSLNMGVLPIASFTPGPVAFAQKLAAKMRVPQYTVHATFEAGFKGKRLSLRELMLFADPPEYYAAESEGRAGFLSMELWWPEVPEGYGDWDASRNRDMILMHLNGMAMQLEQIRAGMAMARALNRTFVMPKMLCLCDRFGAAHDRCRRGGAATQDLPFVCPASQIFDPLLLGPPHSDVPVREHSFFDNPRGPPQLPSDAAVASTRRTPWCSSSVEAETLLEVQPGLSERQLLDVLGRGSPADGRRQLHVLDPLTMWSRFEAPEDEHRFSNQFLSVLLSLERADTRVDPYRDWFARPPESRRSLDQNYTAG